MSTRHTVDIWLQARGATTNNYELFTDL